METEKPTFSKYFITSVHCSLIWYYDSNIVSTLYIYPTQSVKSNKMSVIILIVTSSYFCNLIYVTFQPKQWQKVNCWQKSLLYRILLNQDKLVIYIYNINY